MDKEKKEKMMKILKITGIVLLCLYIIFLIYIYSLTRTPNGKFRLSRYVSAANKYSPNTN